MVSFLFPRSSHRVHSIICTFDEQSCAITAVFSLRAIAEYEAGYICEADVASISSLHTQWNSVHYIELFHQYRPLHILPVLPMRRQNASEGVWETDTCKVGRHNAEMTHAYATLHSKAIP